jgi:hypothetical protein
VSNECFPGGNIGNAPLPLDATLAAIAARQHGVVGIAQLLELGLGRSSVSRRVASGRLHPVHRGVYAVGHRRLSQDGYWMAAVLAAGRGAALSHLSAAMLWRIWRRGAGHIDVTGPRRRRSQREHRELRVHHARRRHPHDVTAFHDIPVTTVARTLVDLTDVLDAHQLANAIHEAAFRRRLDLTALDAAKARANGRHNLAVLSAALTAHTRGSAGTRSALEDSFLALVLPGPLAEPLVNEAIQAGGRRIEVDFHWPGLRLCVEVDGDGHTRPRTRQEDQARDRLLRGAGYEILRFTGDDVERRPGVVLATLEATTRRLSATPPSRGRPRLLL